MKLTLGFSPCPNDTFIFDALVNNKIDSGGLDFEVILEDVETLNEWALKGKLDITKLSFPAFFQAIDKYTLLNAGSALGNGVGPLLVCLNQKKEIPGKIKTEKIALPGINTTANMLFSFAYPEANNKIFMVFSAIEEAVLDGKTELGVIIHENRFTYQQRGLKKVADLGEFWEKKMKLPVPLGGIVIKRKADKGIISEVDKLIRRSIEYAFHKYPEVSDYVRQHSQTMSDEVMRRHIDLYVNNCSVELGSGGKAAIEKLYEVFLRINEKPKTVQPYSLFSTKL